MTPLINAAHRLVSEIAASQPRAISQFARDEYVIPTGPYAGQRLRMDTLPYTALLLSLMDDPHWREVAVTGPAQSSKSVLALHIPTMYHLFERGETVVVCTPDRDMARDKWVVDLLPAIEASRYRNLIPQSGPAARGGFGPTMRFANGAKLRWMTGSSSDRARAGFAARIAIITEADAMGAPGIDSPEADKISQIKARTAAYAGRSRVYLESTPTIETGAIWSHWSTGTATLVLLRCPHCEAQVHPERPHLVGWQDAETEEAAAIRARLACPACGAEWTEEERRKAAAGATISHSTDAESTRTLGFRWTAAANLLMPLSELARKEWRAKKRGSPDELERDLCQNIWGIPYRPPEIECIGDWRAIAERKAPPERGIVPAEAKGLTVGLDLGDRLCHWVCTAHSPTRVHIVDYGLLDVMKDELGLERGLTQALAAWAQICEAGWPVGGVSGTPMRPGRGLIDSGSGAHQPAVYSFCRSNPRHLPSKGTTAGRAGGTYRAPRAVGGDVLTILPGLHVTRQTAAGVSLVDLDSDYWKTSLRDRLSIEMGSAGAVTLFLANRDEEHAGFARQILAEELRDEFVAGKGVVRRWFQVHRQNHFLDAACLALAAAGLVGCLAANTVSVARPARKPQPAPPGPPRRPLARRGWQRSPFQRR